MGSKVVSAPTLIGKYSVIRELGAGGFGAVYQCRDPDLGRDVAVKVFKPRDANNFKNCGF